MTWFVESAILAEEPQQEFVAFDWHPQGPPAAAWAYRSLTICLILSESISFISGLPRSKEVLFQ
jgi:hypothetical protein